jgi:CheY-like chemotaxis protein
MIQPLILCVYERLLPAGQLVNRLQDLGYRVQSIGDPATLTEQAEHEKPLLVMADLEPPQNKVCEAIAALKKNSGTSHIPVIAFSSARNPTIQEAARNAGATLVVNDSAILVHLDQFLEQALQVD